MRIFRSSMSGLPPESGVDVSNVPILLQKSPRRSCRIKIRNNRIGANGFLNQRCALTPDLESILRTQTGKILLQQNRHMKTARFKSTSQASRIGETTRQEHRGGE